MKKFIIRRLLKKDYEGVRNVDVQTQKQYLGNKFDLMNEEEQERHLVSRKKEFNYNVDSEYSYVAIIDKTIVGFLFAYETLPYVGNIYIRYIGINPKYQGKSIGFYLYKELIHEAKKNNIKKITACINLDNPNSMKLHQKAGFLLKDRKEATLDFSTPTG